MSYCGFLVRYLEEISCLIVVFWLDIWRKDHVLLCCFGKIFVGEIMSYCGVLVRYLEEISCLIVIFWLDKCRRYHVLL
jgi:tRNA (Thr-GGU) A37 N-methylase